MFQFAECRKRHFINERIVPFNLFYQWVNDGDTVVNPNAHRFNMIEQAGTRRFVIKHIAKP